MTAANLVDLEAERTYVAEALTNPRAMDEMWLAPEALADGRFALILGAAE